MAKPKPVKPHHLEMVEHRPDNPANDRLSRQKLEYLTDKMVMRFNDPDINEALMLIMDECERVALSNHLDIETVTGPVIKQAYYRMNEQPPQQQAVIAELRAKVAQLDFGDDDNG